MDTKSQALPVLGPTPTRHADCCLSLSTNLLGRIIAVASEGAPDGTHRTILSIGSGSGLLEYLLLLQAQSLDPKGNLLIEGVEVQQSESQPSVNRYLPEQDYHTVQRTSTISQRLYDSDVVGLMFVYPRQPSLVMQYLQEVRRGNTYVHTITWLGPQADWDDFSACFNPKSSERLQTAEITILSGKEAGLDQYELMATIRLHRGADP